MKSTSRSRRLFLVLTTAASLAASASAPAWEGDVHYALTRWLALKAGFSSNDANDIAVGDQSLDEGKYTPAPYAVSWAILFNDPKASEAVQKGHFPSEATVPAPPADRMVTPGSKAALRDVERCIADKRHYPNELRDLGEALHPLQDSWSHQGVPDSPFRPLVRVRQDYTSSHPKERGGWASHDADLTYLHVSDLMATAKSTYDQLLEYRRTHRRHYSGKSAPWSDIEPKLKAFAEANTKEAKQSWAAAEGINGSGVVDRTSLPGGPSGGLLFHPALASDNPPRQEIPKALGDLVRQILDAWRERDTAQLINQVEWSTLREQFPEGMMSDREDIVRWCRKFFNMWWVDDHGVVNQAGHCDPTRPGYKELPESPEKEGSFRSRQSPETYFDSSSLIRLDKETLALGKANGEVFGLAFQAAPRDAVILAFAQSGDQWRIVRMLWVII